MLVWWSLLAVAWSAPPAEEEAPACEPVPAAELAEVAERVLGAWSSLDAEGVAEAQARLEGALPCVDGPVAPDVARRVHLARGLVAFLDDDADAALRAYVAARAITPEGEPVPGGLAAEHPLQRLWARALEVDEEAEGYDLRRKVDVAWSLDGVPQPDDASRLPGDRAFVLQVFGTVADRGPGVLYTGYHFSPVDVPASALPVGADPETRRRRQRQSRRWGTVVGGLLLGGAATTFGLGMVERQRFLDGEVGILDAEEVQAKANLYGGISAGLAAAGATLGTVVWTVKW